jgi:very-short-patch-repair endonuclease
MGNEVAIEHLQGVGSSAREREQAMSALAKTQHGVVARRQLLALGFGRRAITGALERGRLHEVFLGVYVVGVRRISRRGRWMAATLAAGEGALLSHRSAARLWRLMPAAAERIDVTVPTGRVVRRQGIVSHESLVAEDEWVVRDGIPLTSPFRTIFDLAAAAPMREVERAFHEAEVRGFTDRVSLPALLERYPGRRGTRNLRALLESPEPIGLTRNDFEEAFLVLVDAHGLHRPRMNADLSVRGRFFQVDALWEKKRVVVELDSHSVHGTRKRFESDRHRDRILAAEGYRIVHVTWRHLRKEPGAIVADIKAALGQGHHPHPPGK